MNLPRRLTAVDVLAMCTLVPEMLAATVAEFDDNAVRLSGETKHFQVTCKPLLPVASTISLLAP